MAKTQSTITVLGNEVALWKKAKATVDFISLTDLAKHFNAEKPADLIAAWMRNADTLEFLEVWEKLNNPDFNVGHLAEVKKDVGKNRFSISPGKWIETTGAVGLVVQKGRYGGGTFAHPDLAMGFCFWLKPAFQLQVIQEFQRLKADEAARSGSQLEWSLRRAFSKINYRLHVDAVRNYLVPPRLVGAQGERLFFASEADLLNLALFGQTAAEWRKSNQNLPGNMRDHASVEQLLVLANLENLNAAYLKMGIEAAERLQLLNAEAIHQIQLLVESPSLRELGGGPFG